MNNWTPWPHNDQDEGVDYFSVGVIVITFVVLAVWGVLAG